MTAPLRIGLLEPHLGVFGGIRRMLEFGNRLVARGHDVTFYVADEADPRCDWMPCAPTVRRVRDGHDDELDVLVFNHEPQWFHLDSFRQAGARVFYALHYARLYSKAGSWESLRVDVDRRLANSTWTADMIEAELGERPAVVLGGINQQHFRPLDEPKRYPLLCVGDERAWKGTETIRRAATMLTLPMEAYAPKRLPQAEMAAEYSRAEVFVVGSHFEGFGQPGLEALACGTPLVTTDNGGCRDYAFDGETALVVPPGDAHAMAEAIARLRGDPSLARRLRDNGLELVRTRFDWDRATDVFEGHLEEVAATVRPSTARATRLRPMPPEPTVSIVVLQWNQLQHTQRCVESIRQHTDIDYELVIVDNGSESEAAAYANASADAAVLNPTNTGFAAGMNRGLAAARGEFIVFLNNDTLLPPRWASRLIDTFREHPRAGIVVPALTEARNVRTVRTEPSEHVEALDPFEAPPSGVLYMMRADVARDLGGWSETYGIASGEDLDLCFSVWLNDLDIVFDARVLVEHVGKASSSQLDDWRDLWERNRQLFFARWTAATDDGLPHLATCPRDRWERNRATARATAGWMRSYFRARASASSTQAAPRPPRVAPRVRAFAGRNVGRARPLIKALWPLARRVLPRRTRERVLARWSTEYYELYPERHPDAMSYRRALTAPPAEGSERAELGTDERLDLGA